MEVLATPGARAAGGVIADPVRTAIEPDRSSDSGAVHGHLDAPATGGVAVGMTGCREFGLDHLVETTCTDHPQRTGVSKGCVATLCLCKAANRSRVVSQADLSAASGRERIPHSPHVNARVRGLITQRNDIKKSTRAKGCLNTLWQWRAVRPAQCLAGETVLQRQEGVPAGTQTVARVGLHTGH